MAIKHSTVHNPNEIVPSADWNANHTGTAEPEAHAIDGAKHTGDITDTQHGVRTLANAHAHSHLSGIGTDDHHAQAHTLASHSTKAHAELTDVTSDQHHPQAHTLASHSTKAHAELTDVTSDQHHAKSHAHDGIDGSGTVAHSDTTGRTANDHHAQAHTLASHSTKAHAELTNVTSDQHHAQSHNAASHSDIASTGANIDDAVTKKHTQGTDTTLGAMTAVINMNTHRINNVVDPALNQDAATKKYVDDTAGGAPVDASYLTLGLNGDLTAERVLTAGEGIDFTDTGINGTLTINGENASTVNKGIAKFSAGEGMDVSAVAGTITYSGEDATTANKGIASFNIDHFAVAAGQASLNNLVVNSINANTAHRAGDGSDHSLLTSKTSYWSCAGTRFRARLPDVDDVNYDPVAVTADQDNVILACSVDLPHGAVVTAVIVYGNAAATAETWDFYRVDHASGIAVMAGANIGTEDNTINNPTIDNANYSYVLATSSIDENDTIYGARITYTTNYN